MTNAKHSTRFLDAFSSIEQHLRRITRSAVHVPFVQLVDGASRSSAPVRRFTLDLKQFGDLRNAIVNMRAGRGQVIAEPVLETVLGIENIATRILTPPRVERFIKSVIVAQVGDRIQDVARTMSKNRFSQIPIFDASGFRGVLVAQTIVRWLGVRPENAAGWFDVTVTEVMKYQERNDNFEFVGRESTLADVIEIFDRANREGRLLDAILITESGRRSQKIIGFMNIADLPHVFRLLDGR